MKDRRAKVGSTGEVTDYAGGVAEVALDDGGEIEIELRDEWRVWEVLLPGNGRDEIPGGFRVGMKIKLLKSVRLI